MIKKISVAITLLLAAIICSCSQKITPIGNEPNPPEVPKQILFKCPTSVNTPEELKNNIDQFNSRCEIGYSYLTKASVIKPTNEENKSIWNITAGVYRGVVTAETQNNNSVDWTVSVDGSDGIHTYIEWMAILGNATVDGTTGTWHVFEENSTDKMGDYNWTIDQIETEGIFVSEDSTGIYEVTNNQDKSGQFIIKENDIKVYEAIWDASGSGTWTKKDPQGNIIDSGTWL